MKLAMFSEATTQIAADQPQYETMPAHVADDGCVTCCWELTFQERLRLLWRGKVWHQILTFHGSLQPQRLDIDKPDLK